MKAYLLPAIHNARYRFEVLSGKIRRYFKNRRKAEKFAARIADRVVTPEKHKSKRAEIKLVLGK